MDQMTHETHGQAADPHAGHKISKGHGNHDRHTGHSVAMFRDKFWLSFALTIPVVFWSMDVQHWLGYTSAFFPRIEPKIVGSLCWATASLSYSFELGP
jgi:Cu2+-exporting ATPase